MEVADVLIPATAQPHLGVPDMTIIAFTGYAGAGKSTAANILIENGWARGKFAAPLKNMLRSLLRDQGASADLIERMIEGDLKEVRHPMLNGRTPRHAMQTLGTEWGRTCINEDLWVDAAMRNILGPTVFDDCRFPNEAAAIQSSGGIVVEVRRQGVGPVNGHVSEVLPEPDWILKNDGDLNALRFSVLNMSMGL